MTAIVATRSLRCGPISISSPPEPRWLFCCWSPGRLRIRLLKKLLTTRAANPQHLARGGLRSALADGALRFCGLARAGDLRVVLGAVLSVALLTHVLAGTAGGCVRSEFN